MIALKQYTHDSALKQYTFVYTHVVICHLYN
jgi:hypothetical protein